MLRRSKPAAKPAAVLTLAMINVFTLAAGITVARMLPPRLPGPKGPAGGARPAAALGPQVSAVVADPATGRVLLSQDGSRMMTPASTTKLVTSAAALAVLG